MKLLNNHYFSTLSCYNTRLLDSLQAKFLRLPSRSRSFILPCSCKFSVCPKNRVSVFRFMKKTCIFLFFFLSQKRCKECALAHSGVSRGRLRQPASSHEYASLFQGISYYKKAAAKPTSLNIDSAGSQQLLFNSYLQSRDTPCRSCPLYVQPRIPLPNRIRTDAQLSDHPGIRRSSGFLPVPDSL